MVLTTATLLVVIVVTSGIPCQEAGVERSRDPFPSRDGSDCVILAGRKFPFAEQVLRRVVARPFAVSPSTCFSSHFFVDLSTQEA